MEPIRSEILRKILRAFKDYTTEKYKLLIEEGAIHVHELNQCKYKSELVRDIPELSNPLKPPIFIGEAIDTFLKELFQKHEKLRDFTESVEGVYRAEIEVGDKKFVLVGKPDIVAKDYVIEIKYTQIENGLPLEHHVKQVMLYKFLTGKPFGKIIYVTPKGFREFDVEESFDEESLKEFIESWSSPRYDWECQYCGFKQLCPYYKKPIVKEEDVSEEQQ